MRMADQGHSARKAAKAASLPVSVSLLAAQPDALGTATRLAAQRLRKAGIPLEPLLRRTGLSEFQIDTPDARIGVASQIAFLELAAAELGEPLLGFKAACDFDLRQTGLLFYVAASSETLGDALERVQRYSSIVNAGVVLKCATGGDLRISVRYAGVARHSDRQHMEFLVTNRRQNMQEAHEPAAGTDSRPPRPSRIERSVRVRKLRGVPYRIRRRRG